MINKTDPTKAKTESMIKWGSRIVSGFTLALGLVLPAWAEKEPQDKQANHVKEATQPIRLTSDLPFERVFTTPQQRSALDNARRNGSLKRTSQISGVDENTTSAPQANNQPAQPFKLSGVLLRADGQHQVWVSGESGRRENPTFNRKILGDISQSANVKVPLQGSHQAAILKPGQVWLPNNQRAEESYRLAVPQPVVVPEPTKKVVVQPVASSVFAQASSASVSSARSAEVQSSVQFGTK